MSRHSCEAPRAGIAREPGGPCGKDAPFYTDHWGMDGWQMHLCEHHARECVTDGSEATGPNGRRCGLDDDGELVEVAS